jgi:hypothetical protein
MLTTRPKAMGSAALLMKTKGVFCGSKGSYECHPDLDRRKESLGFFLEHLDP